MSRADWLAKGIYWDESVNDQTGCSKDGREGCSRCWAERFSVRLEAMGKSQYAGATQKGKWSGKIRLWPQAQAQVLRWKKPRVIFWNDMSDPFHKDVPFSHIDRKMAIIALTPQHTHLMLTKRPERMLEYLRWEDFDPSEDRRDMINVAANEITGTWDDTVPKGRWPLPNLIIGVSVWDQESADRMIPILLETNLATRIVSFEPALGAVDFGEWFYPEKKILPGPDGGKYRPVLSQPKSLINGVILGGESGPGARPMHPDIPRSVRDQCQAAGVKFLFKQWGEWAPGYSKSRLNCCISNYPSPNLETVKYQRKAGRYVLDDPICMEPDRGACGAHSHPYREQCEMMSCVHKKAAGRLLDGVEHNELAEVMR